MCLYVIRAIDMLLIKGKFTYLLTYSLYRLLIANNISVLALHFI